MAWERGGERGGGGGEPVDGHPPAVGQAVREAVDRVSHRTFSLRQRSTFAWSPDRRTSGTVQPRNSAGRVKCGYSRAPPSSGENDPTSPHPSLSPPPRRRALPPPS